MMMMAGMALVFFLLALAWYLANNVEIGKATRILQARELCREVGETVNSVSVIGNNARSKFTLPSRLGAANYNLTIFAPAKVVYVAVKGGDIYCPMLTPNVTNGTRRPGTPNAEAGSRRIWIAT